MLGVHVLEDKVQMCMAQERKFLSPNVIMREYIPQCLCIYALLMDSHACE